MAKKKVAVPPPSTPKRIQDLQAVLSALTHSEMMDVAESLTDILIGEPKSEVYAASTMAGVLLSFAQHYGKED